MKMEQHCVNCKHWDPYYGQAPDLRRQSVARKVWKFGDCTNPKFPSPCSTIEQPETRADFGCVLFEKNK
jgi:hypothetical protein